MPVPRFPPLAVSLAVSLGLGGCMGDANPVRDRLNAAGIGPRAVAAPDFVAQSRPAALDYVPVGTSAPPRDRARSAAEVRALEAELEAARGRNEARGGLAGAASRRARGPD